MPSKLKSGIAFEPVPFADAAEWIRGKTPVTREVWDAMLPELRGRAFLVTGIEDLNLIQEIRDIVADLPEGTDYWKLKDRIAEKLMESPHFNETRARRRAELILRHNGFAAYAAADWRRMKKVADFFPYWQYRTMGDEAVRESHAALHGLTLRHDDPFWLDHFPPWEWGCRCQVVSVDEDEFEEIKRLRTAGSFNPVFEEKTKGWTLPDEGLKVLHGQNILFDGGPNPKGVLVESKEMFKPGDLAIPPEELKARYDPEDWAAFEAKAKATDIGDGRTVWDWMNGVPAPAGARAARPRTTPPPTYAFDPADPVCTALQCEKGPPLSIEDAARGTNPRFSEGGDYRVNCQRCVAAYELRRRGYRVEAKPKPRSRIDKLVGWGTEVFGIQPDSWATGKGPMSGMSGAQMRAFLESQPDGARFVVWLSRGLRKSGHVFSAEKVNGTLRIVDGQGGVLDASGHLLEIRRLGQWRGYWAVRVDTSPVTGDVRVLQSAVQRSQP